MDALDFMMNDKNVWQFDGRWVRMGLQLVATYP